MSFWKHAKLLGPLLSIAIVGVCVGSSLTGYELPSYEVEAQAAQPEEEDTAADEDIMAEGNWDLEDGVYRGTGVGYSGDVTVDVTIADRTITQIDIVSETDDDAFFNRAKAVIDEIITSQSLEVDVVSGATYSSNGIINAVKNALTGEVDDSETAPKEEPQGESTIADVTEAAAYKDGTYYGTGVGFGGEMTVKVTISGGKIVSIEIVSNKDDAAYFNKAKVLLSTIVEKQSTNVDTISGATYSSVGIIQAVRSALSKAAADPSAAAQLNASSSDNSSSNTKKNTTPAKPSVTGAFPYPDGVYTGTAEGYGSLVDGLSDITVSVTIKNQTMTDITVTAHEDETPRYYEQAVAVINEMIAAQSTDVDVVSGATYSSNGIINAVKEALAQAKKAAEGTSDADKPDKDNTGKDDSKSDGDNTGKDDSKSDGDNTGKDDSKSDDDNSGKDDGKEDEPKVYIYKDGTYFASATCVDLEGDFTDYALGVSVTIEKDKVTAITDVTEDGVLYDKLHSDNYAYIKKVVQGTKKLTGVVDQIMALQLFDANTKLNEDTKNLSSDANTVNAVSGATCSSKALYAAVQDVLKQAKEAQEKDAQAKTEPSEEEQTAMDQEIGE